MVKTIDKTETMILEKNNVLYNKADKNYLIRLFFVQIHNYDLLVCDYTCTMTPNDQIVYRTAITQQGKLQVLFVS